MLPAMLTPLLGSDRAGQIAPALGQAVQKLKAGGYQNTRADLLRAISESGVSKQQLTGMVGMLNSPLATGILNRVAPGLAEGLRGLGNEICGGNQAAAKTGGGISDKFPPLKKR